MPRNGQGFILNVDQSDRRGIRRVPKPFLWVVGLISITAALGAAAYGAEQVEARSPAASGGKVAEGKKLEDHAVQRTVSVNVKSTKDFDKKTANAVVVADDLKLVPKGQGPSDLTLRGTLECNAANPRYIRSTWTVKFPNGEQTDTINMDLCFVYSDTVKSTLVFTSKQLGFGDYELRGVIYDEEWKLTWTGGTTKITDVHYSKTLEVTSGSWQDWLR